MFDFDNEKYRKPCLSISNHKLNQRQYKWNVKDRELC